MARRLAIPSKDVQVRIVGPTGVFTASRVQRITMNNDIPTTEVYELGNQDVAGVSQDTANLTVTFSAFDTGIKIIAVMAGEDWTAFPGAGVSVTDLGEVDIVIDIKDATTDTIVKAGHGKRLQVRDFSYSYSVDGEATEDYTLIGSEKRWFTNEVVVDKFTSGTTSFTLSETPIQLKNGDYALSVILDGAYLEEVAATPDSGEYSVSGTTLTTHDSMVTQALVVYHAAPAEAWVDLDDSDMPAAIRGRDIAISISAGGISRVQSVTLNGNLNVQPVREMGSRTVIGYQRQVPTVEGTVTVLDTDTELVSLFTTGTLSGSQEFISDDLCPTTGIPLKIELLDPCDATLPYTVFKTLYMDEIVLTGDSFTSNVNNNATQTFNFKSISASLTIYSGAMP